MPELSVEIPVFDQRLPGLLTTFPDMKGMVVFAHGSGSSRLSPRNREVASFLHNAALGTFLFDLLTQSEDSDYSNRFQIDLLASRLIEATQWLSRQPGMEKVPFAFFGASTGAAAALEAATGLPYIRAVVSRGGRPDLVMHLLHLVTAPTLLMVGGLDTEVLALNKIALEKLAGPKKLSVVPNATHLFEEPGALREVCLETSAWLLKYLS